MTLLKPSYALSSRWIRGLLLSLLLLLVSLSVVLAQAPITVSSQVEAQFPSAITFTLSATSQSPITSAVLRYRLERISCFEEIVDRHLNFTPSPEVQASWTLDMRKIGGLPTGARLRYQWLIEDADGNRLVTPEETLRFEDTRYPWRSLEQGMVTLRWYQGDEAFASRLMAAAQSALDRLSRDTGTRLEHPVELYIYESTAALRQARIFPQAWEGGVAFPSYGLVAIGIAQEQLAWGEEAVAHELAHLGVYQMSFNCYQDLPTWLNEGLAEYAEGDPTPDERSRLEQAIAASSIISVKSLSSSFPADPQQALLSYAESRSIVAFLIQDYGQDKLLELVDSLRRGHTYDQALLQTYGFDTQGLDAAWRDSIGAPPPPPPATPGPTPAPAATPTPLSTPPTPVPTQSPAPVTQATPTPTPTATPTPQPPTRGGFSCARGGALSLPKGGAGPAGADLGALLGIGMLLTAGVARWSARGRRG